MGIHLGRVGHIGIHVSDVDRSIDFYRRVLGLKLTGRWAPPDIGRPICFMRIDDKHTTSCCSSCRRTRARRASP
jgi:catechol 2,3-dioxygenase-like lactoylglutathione lyase family enzyme